MAGEQNKVPSGKQLVDLTDGITRLQEGRYAAPWICRELLDLDAVPTLMEIQLQLHKAIHAWCSKSDPLDDADLIAAIAAAGVLVRMLRK